MTSNHTAAFTGVGHSRVFRHDDVPLGILAVEACRNALTDAGLEPSDVDGIACAPMQPFGSEGLPLDGRDFVSSIFLVRALGLRVAWGADVNGLLMHSVVEAINAVESGLAKNVLLFRALHSPSGAYGHSTVTRAAGVSQFREPYGIFPPATWAEMWNRYRDKYGSGTREQMAAFVVQSRANGLLWEHSYWRQYRPEELTIEQYLSSRMVATPFTILDCDIPVQGCGAFVITTAERAADAPNRPAYVRGLACLRIAPASAVDFTLDHDQECARETVARLTRDSGGIPAKEVSLANLYDGFSFIAMLWLEAFGFCGEGEAFDFVQDGRVGLSGELPVNTCGGNLGCGRMHGVPHLMDAILQVGGRSGARQVTDARLALAAIGSPSLSGAVLVGSEPV